MSFDTEDKRCWKRKRNKERNKETNKKRKKKERKKQTNKQRKKERKKHMFRSKEGASYHSKGYYHVFLNWFVSAFHRFQFLFRLKKWNKKQKTIIVTFWRHASIVVAAIILRTIWNGHSNPCKRGGLRKILSFGDVRQS